MPQLTIRDENGEISQNITKEQRKAILDFVGPLAVVLPKDVRGHCAEGERCVCTGSAHALCGSWRKWSEQ